MGNFNWKPQRGQVNHARLGFGMGILLVQSNSIEHYDKDTLCCQPLVILCAIPDVRAIDTG
jgi:hypothetical protein